MKHKAILGLQVAMGIVAVFHLLMGIGLNAAPGFAETAAKWYGADVAEWSSQFLYILRPLGVFMFALGIFAAAAALKPEQHRVTVYVFAGIFIVRAVHRILFSVELSEVFGIASSRNMINIVFFFLLAAALIIIEQLAHRSSAGEAPVET